MQHLPKLLALAAAVAAWPAHAALTSTSVSCDGQGTGMTSITGYLDCSGAWAGNNLNQATDVANQILADWGLSGLSPLDITGGNAGSAGSLSFAAQTGKFVVSLKSGDAFSLYEFDGTNVVGGISSISFDTLGVGFFSGKGGGTMHFGQGLSHADLYIAAVPEPQTYLLMLAGFAFTTWRLRRQVRE